jgi:S1-C subfamily serine protease
VSWVDVLVVLLAIVAGISGWRHGLAVAFLSFVGVLGGAILGVQLAPLLAANVEAKNTQVVVSVVVVVVLVALGETTGVYFGRHIRDRLTGERTLTIDSALGSVLQAITVVLAAWLVALPLATANVPGLASEVRASHVLRAVDSVMPAPARELPADLRQVLDNSGFPDVLSPFAPTPITQVGPPNQALAGSSVVEKVQDSILKIRGKAPSCSRQLEGSGFVIGPELVLTNAHVVAGTSETSVEVINSKGRTRDMPAAVISYDAGTDLAVLYVRGLQAPALQFATEPAAIGDDAIVIGYPLDGPFTPTPAKIRDRIQLRGPNIYDSGDVTREVYTVRAVVRSGNSGGPMIRPDGKVLGVVFGAALDDSETGFVLTATQVAPTLQKAPTFTRPVETGRCAA